MTHNEKCATLYLRILWLLLIGYMEAFNAYKLQKTLETIN